MPKKIDESVLRVLDRSTTDGHKLHLPQEQLDRALYAQVAKVIEAAGGKWVRHARAHVFPADGPSAADAIEPIMLTGEVTFAKQELGAFFTPPAVQKRMFEILKPKPGEVMLEPSVGRGALAIPAMSAGVIVRALDIHLANIDWMRANTSAITLRQGDFLDPDALLDFESLFDIIAMNPPFAHQADIHHVLRAIEVLRPGGRLCAVMSASVTFRSNKLTLGFRQLIADRKGVIEHLPENSFKSSGTGVNTVLVSFNCN